MAYPKILFAYDRVRSPIIFKEKTLTHQSFKNECNINSIMARYSKSGLIEHVNTHNGQYGDFSDLPGDYQGCVDLVLQAREMFGTLPAALRSKFNNDPGVFLDFTSNPDNQAEMKELGLLPASSREDKSTAEEAQASEGTEGE